MYAHWACTMNFDFDFDFPGRLSHSYNYFSCGAAIAFFIDGVAPLCNGRKKM